MILAAAAFADDITLISGKEYKGVTVTRVEADGIMVMTDSGIEKLYFAWLPKEIQQKYGYNPAAAAAYAAQNAAVQQRIAQSQQQEQQEDQAQAAQTPQAIHPVRIVGTVEESDQDGLLVSTEIADWFANGGNVVLARDKSRPKLGSLQEEVYIVGHPKQSEIVNKDGIDVDAVLDGTYMSATGKIRQFRVTAAYKDPFK